MVSLYDAVKLTGRLDDDKDTVYLKKHRNDDTLFSKDMPDEILTVKRLKETYDLRHTEVVRIEAYFCCGGLSGPAYCDKGGYRWKEQNGTMKKSRLRNDS